MTSNDFLRAAYFLISLAAVVLFLRLYKRKLGFEIIVYAALITLIPGIAFFIVRYFIRDTALLNFMSLMVYITGALAWLSTALALWHGSKGEK